MAMLMAASVMVATATAAACYKENRKVVNFQTKQSMQLSRLDLMILPWCPPCELCPPCPPPPRATGLAVVSKSWPVNSTNKIYTEKQFFVFNLKKKFQNSWKYFLFSFLF